MNIQMQKKLYKALDTISSSEISSTQELFKKVIEALIKDDKYSVTGARIWVFDKKKRAYRIFFQSGKVRRIPKDFLLLIDESEIFDKIAEERTIIATEINDSLIEKGIFRYSASGFGKKIKLNNKLYYEYLLALSSDHLTKEFKYLLNVVATLLTSKLKERELVSKTDNLLEDINKARKLQASLLPEHEYYFHDYCIYGVTIPAKILGGDFYDYLKIGEGEERLGIVVGDAASKGLDAAAEAMYISGAIRMASYFQIKISPFMSRLNHLVNQIFSDDRFTSLFYGELSDDSKGLFLYSNAGQNPPLMLKSNGKFQWLEVSGPLLGPAPVAKYETESVYFSPGDILVIYSDGIVETANNKFQFFGENRLKKIVKKYSELSPKMLAFTILEEVEKFATEKSKYQDDKTLVIIKRKKQQ